MLVCHTISFQQGFYLESMIYLPSSQFGKSSPAEHRNTRRDATEHQPLFSYPYLCRAVGLARIHASKHHPKRLCAFQDFKVYTAASMEQLASKVQAKENVWCGWHNFLGQHSCVARLSPFGPVHVAVAHSSSSSDLLNFFLPLFKADYVQECVAEQGGRHVGGGGGYMEALLVECSLPSHRCGPGSGGWGVCGRGRRKEAQIELLGVEDIGFRV